MMPDDIPVEQQVKELIVERLFMEIDPSEIGDEDSLSDQWEIDSVRLFEVVVGLEEVFGVTFEDEEFTVDNFETVKAISDCVRRKLEGEEEEPEE